MTLDPMNSSPFVPLTEHEIERIRVAFQAFSADAEQADRLTRLCDMALASITRPEVERNKILEECAQACEESSASEFAKQLYDRTDRAMMACAIRIRAMKSFPSPQQRDTISGEGIDALIRKFAAGEHADVIDGEATEVP